MRTLFFGTYDERTHPRVRALREGLRSHGVDVATCNVPLGIGTAARVALLRQPWQAPLLLLKILSAWARLLLRSRGQRPDVVVVGYLGHFDVHLARLRFRRATIVLDHLVGLGDTSRDRGLTTTSRVGRLLDWIDDRAVRAADIVVVDTHEQAEVLPPAGRGKAVVVAVGAPSLWFSARAVHQPTAPDLRVVFFGLFTPLQGAVTIGTALRRLVDIPFECTMIGNGQDLQAARAAAGPDPRISWLDWVEADELPALVAAHDVCLGIFGDGPKARRVVANKVFQGAAAGCAIITSDTPPQRRLLDDAAVLVPPCDADALAAAIAQLATDPGALAERRGSSAALADQAFTAAAVVEPLLARLDRTH